MLYLEGYFFASLPTSTASSGGCGVSYTWTVTCGMDRQGSITRIAESRTYNELSAKSDRKSTSPAVVPARHPCDFQSVQDDENFISGKEVIYRVIYLSEEERCRQDDRFTSLKTAIRAGLQTALPPMVRSRLSSPRRQMYLSETRGIDTVPGLQCEISMGTAIWTAIWMAKICTYSADSSLDAHAAKVPPKVEQRMSLNTAVVFRRSFCAGDQDNYHLKAENPPTCRLTLLTCDGPLAKDLATSGCRLRESSGCGEMRRHVGGRFRSGAETTAHNQSGNGEINEKETHRVQGVGGGPLAQRPFCCGGNEDACDSKGAMAPVGHCHGGDDTELGIPLRTFPPKSEPVLEVHTLLKRSEPWLYPLLPPVQTDARAEALPGVPAPVTVLQAHAWRPSSSSLLIGKFMANIPEFPTLTDVQATQGNCSPVQFDNFRHHPVLPHHEHAAKHLLHTLISRLFVLTVSVLRYECLRHKVSNFDRYSASEDNSVEMFEDVAALLPTQPPARPSTLTDLDNSPIQLFDGIGDLDEFTRALWMLEKAAALLHNSHPDKPLSLRRMGDSNTLTPDRHPDKHLHLADFGNCLCRRFDEVGSVDDLEASVRLLEQATTLTPDRHPDKHLRLMDLGSCLLRRFDEVGSVDDLTMSVSLFETVSTRIPDGHPDKPSRLIDLGYCLLRHFDEIGRVDGLTRSVSVFKAANTLIPDGHQNKLLCLGLLGISLRHQFGRSESVHDINESVTALRAAIDLCSLPNIDRALILINFANSLLCRFEHLGNLKDLQEALPIMTEAVNLSPDIDPNNDLAYCLVCWFEKVGNLKDLKAAVVMFESSAGSDHSRLHRALGAAIPAISQLLCRRNTVARCTAVEVLAVLVAYSSLRNSLVDDIPLINSQLARSRQDTTRAGEPTDLPPGTAKTTSISRTTQDSGIRRRGLQSKEDDTYHPFPTVSGPSTCFRIPEELRNYLTGIRSYLPFTGTLPQTQPPSIAIPDIISWLENTGNFIGATYVFMIAPPFLHDRVSLWDLHWLENRLGAFQTWVWAAHAALFGASVALLALAGLSSSPVAQSFVILCGIFALFGFVYTVFLVFRIGDCKGQYSGRFIDRANSMQAAHLFWNVAIMLSLPLTWMTWAVFSLFCFMLSLGVQQAILDVRSAVGRDTKTGISLSATKGLSIVQLCGFMVAIVWSTSYIFLIHVEIRRCMDSSNSP
ncbi:hypothetical protein DFH08DRAFT_939642 [Mycena albidolilacea]|uniref:Uncharacterized protein n=1 Tax=Mycena albidolilacea TaxID=1033008 RepID=A0AAD6ZR81_9AGAR|nr:hypothetical protein DFH08DRAFT_939642 [Mycena albidolilacea]